MTKTCTTCKQAKPLDLFGKHRQGRYGKRAVCKACNAAANREYVLNNYQKARNSQKNCALKKQYGITLSDYKLLVSTQKYKCLLCGRKRKLHVDHSHATGKVRGLLCFSCNTAIGHLDDNPHRMRKAALYVEESG